MLFTATAWPGLRDGSITVTYRDWKRSDYSFYDALARHLHDCGVICEPDSREPLFVCAAHDASCLADTLKAFKEPGPKIIVLATDGEPDNCECPDFGNTAPAKCREAGVPALIKDQVVAIAKAIHDDDITVHIINVSKPSEAALQQHLTDVAEAGGGKVYPGFSPGALSSAFEEIINGVRSCAIDLTGEIADGKEDTGVVKLDGDVLVLDDPDGWQVNSPSQIELLGEACETIKSGDHDLAIKFPCESFDPVVH